MISYFWLACITILYILFDVNYFLRIAFTIGYGRLFQKKKKIFEKTTIYGEFVWYEGWRKILEVSTFNWIFFFFCIVNYYFPL